MLRTCFQNTFAWTSLLLLGSPNTWRLRKLPLQGRYFLGRDLFSGLYSLFLHCHTTEVGLSHRHLQYVVLQLIFKVIDVLGSLYSISDLAVYRLLGFLDRCLYHSLRFCYLVVSMLSELHDALAKAMLDTLEIAEPLVHEYVEHLRQVLDQEEQILLVMINLDHVVVQHRESILHGLLRSFDLELGEHETAHLYILEYHV